MQNRAARKRVGIFDSGVGGLTVLAACRRAAPENLYFYWGDNARVPYGSRPREEIVRFVGEGLDGLAAEGIDAAVLACNTATAVCAEEMRGRYPFPIVGIEPAVAEAAKSCARILVLATPRTAESGRLRALLARFPERTFTVCALPNLAGAIERFLAGGEPVALSDHLERGDYDGVVLGCTHYSFLRGEISSFFHLPVYDGNEGVANRLRAVLSEKIPKKLGTDDHFQPPAFPSQYLTKNQTEMGLVFLGTCANFNKAVYFRTFVFRKN